MPGTLRSIEDTVVNNQAKIFIIMELTMAEMGNNQVSTWLFQMVINAMKYIKRKKLISCSVKTNLKVLS